MIHPANGNKEKSVRGGAPKRGKEGEGAGGVIFLKSRDSGGTSHTGLQRGQNVYAARSNGGKKTNPHANGSSAQRGGEKNFAAGRATVNVGRVKSCVRVTMRQ